MTFLGRKIRQNDTRIVGQRVVGVDLNIFGRANSGKRAMDPTLILENGVFLRFQTQETESLEYGTEILVVEP